MEIVHLPKHILLYHVVVELSVQDTINLQRTCKFFYRICSEDSVWKNLLLKYLRVRKRNLFVNNEQVFRYENDIPKLYCEGKRDDFHLGRKGKRRRNQK